MNIYLPEFESKKATRLIYLLKDYLTPVITNLSKNGKLLLFYFILGDFNAARYCQLSIFIKSIEKQLEKKNPLTLSLPTLQSVTVLRTLNQLILQIMMLLSLSLSWKNINVSYLKE